MPESDSDSHLENRPPLTLVCGAAGTGKTEWAIRRYLEAAGRALLIVASPAQAETLAAQIAERGGVSLADARLTVLPFRKFVSDTYKERPDDGYQVIGRAFQRIVVIEIVQNTIHRSDFLGRMLDAPGFVGAFTDRLREWKLACVTPEALEAGCCLAKPLLDDPVFPVKTAEFARLFRAYENFLSQRRMRDGEDVLHEVIRHLAGASLLENDPRRFLVDGFFRFNRAQREILAALANRRLPSGDYAIDVSVTLPFDPARPLLFAAPQRARAIFGSEFSVLEENLSECRAVRPPSLRLIEAKLFNSGNSERGTGNRIANSSTHPASRIPHLSPSCSLFSAPNPYVEAEMVAREFRRIHDAGGISWDDFGVILRTQGDYAPILSAVFERYEIPLGADGPEKLDQNPLMKTILHLLDILCNGWQREDVLAFVKSSYTAPGKLAADALRRRARTARVRSGRGGWLALADKLDGTPLEIAGNTLRKVAECQDAWFPERGDPLEFAEGLRQAAGEVFGLTQKIEAGEALRRERDRASWEEAEEGMAAVAQMAAMAGRETLPFAEFCDRLREGWRSASSLASPEGEMARVMEPYESRERPLRVAAVMGVTERVFPRRVNEDPFLRDAERAALRMAAGLDLEEQRDRADDERLFFYLAVTAPTDGLILSYPRSADDSDTLPSFYLDEVRAAFEGADADIPPLRHVTRTLADVAPQADEAVNDADRTLAACADLFDPAASDTDAATRQQNGADALKLRLQTETAAPGIRALLESRNLPRLPRFEDAALQSDFAENKSVYSVTELETYLRCPFQYLLRHVLRLRPDSDEGAASQGDLLHGALRRYFRQRQREQPGAPAPNAETLQSELRALLDEALTKKPLDAAPHRARIMTRTLRDALDGFARREARFTPHLQTRPAHFELAFGVATGRASIADEERGVLLDPADGAKPTYDPASISEPLELTGPQGDLKPVLLCGVIDRVDFDAGGVKAVIMDYKLGRPPDFAAIASGSSLQMPLYLLAMERLFGKIGAAACYDSALETGRRRIYRTEHVNMKQFAPLLPHDSSEHVKPQTRQQFSEIAQAAEGAAIGAARSIEAGRIEARPGDHCAACDYKDVCRTSRASGHDGEALSA